MAWSAFGVRVDLDLREALENMAVARQQSLTGLIRGLPEKAVEASPDCKLVAISKRTMESAPNDVQFELIAGRGLQAMLQSKIEIIKNQNKSHKAKFQSCAARSGPAPVASQTTAQVG